MIKLEGGSDFDLTVLDLPDPEEERKEEGETAAERRQEKRKKDNKEVGLETATGPLAVFWSQFNCNRLRVVGMLLVNKKPVFNIKNISIYRLLLAAGRISSPRMYFIFVFLLKHVHKYFVVVEFLFLIILTVNCLASVPVPTGM